MRVTFCPAQLGDSATDTNLRQVEVLKRQRLAQEKKAQGLACIVAKNFPAHLSFACGSRCQ
jgi:hypothetical protein